MKAFLSVLIILTAFVGASAAEGAKKIDIETKKKIQYYKVMATQEMNILEMYVKCLNGVKDKEMLDLCNRERVKQVSKLRKTATPKPRPKVSPSEKGGEEKVDQK